MQKEANFSRLSKAISIAVREGGGDTPDTNPKLRLMVEKAKAANMPKDNIQRAIDRGAGRIEGAIYEEINYDGFGPGQVAMVIECVTDNRNRTNSEIRAIFDKNGGTLGGQGSTSYVFKRKGRILVKLEEGADVESIQLALIDLGAEDYLNIVDQIQPVIVNPSQTHEIAEKIKNKGYEIIESEIILLPANWVELSQTNYDRFIRFLNIIDDYEDVQNIYHNAKLLE